MSEIIIHTKPVTITLDQLLKGDVSDEALQDAFGPDSLGIIVVSDMDEAYLKLRDTVLRSANDLAQLPLDVLSSLERPDAYWLTGWSLGKEKLANGQPDDKKASYYVNCNFYRDESMEGPDASTTAMYADMKGYTTPNAWPPEKLLPGFQKNLKKLIDRIIDVTLYVSRECDRYMAKKGYEVFTTNAHYLEQMVMNSNTTKARLLHYMPEMSGANSTNGTAWCGEHFDHSCLTALTSNMYVNVHDDLNQEIDLPESLAEKAGLFIRNRHDDLVKVDIPRNAIAFQTGSALEEITRGQFKAVSHLVRGAPQNTSFYRNTLAVFCQPSLQDKVNGDMSFAEYSKMVVEKNH